MIILNIKQKIIHKTQVASLSENPSLATVHEPQDLKKICLKHLLDFCIMDLFSSWAFLIWYTLTPKSNKHVFFVRFALNLLLDLGILISLSGFKVPFYLFSSIVSNNSRMLPFLVMKSKLKRGGAGLGFLWSGKGRSVHYLLNLLIYEMRRIV